MNHSHSGGSQVTKCIDLPLESVGLEPGSCLLEVEQPQLLAFSPRSRGQRLESCPPKLWIKASSHEQAAVWHKVLRCLASSQHPPQSVPSWQILMYDPLLTGKPAPQADVGQDVGVIWRIDVDMVRWARVKGGSHCAQCGFECSEQPRAVKCRLSWSVAGLCPPKCQVLLGAYRYRAPTATKLLW